MFAVLTVSCENKPLSSIYDPDGGKVHPLFVYQILSG